MPAFSRASVSILVRLVPILTGQMFGMLRWNLSTFVKYLLFTTKCHLCRRRIACYLPCPSCSGPSYLYMWGCRVSIAHCCTLCLGNSLLGKASF